MASTRQQKKTEDGDQLHQLVKSAINKLCTSDTFINQLSESMFTIISEKFGKQIGMLEEKINKIEEYIPKQDLILESLGKTQAKYEQLIRKNNILFYGLDEKANTDSLASVLDIFNTKMNLSMINSDVDACFRIGRANAGKTRPLLIKFSNGFHRQSVFSRKKMLKGTKYVIKEDLTAEKVKLLKLTIAKAGGNGKVWTNFGTIFLKFVNNEMVYKISSIEYLNKI